jgi:hypothetical protein
VKEFCWAAIYIGGFPSLAELSLDIFDLRNKGTYPPSVVRFSISFSTPNAAINN